MPKQNDEELLKEIRETYTRYMSAWAYNRQQAKLDMQALSVDGPWEPAERKAREAEKIPCTHTDIISQNNDRVINQFRLNKRGIKITPTGEGASEESAELREKRIRQIEYDSQAIRARITAFQNAVDRGYGFYRVRTDYIGDSFKQKIIIDRIPNPDAVLVDPDAKEADFSDMKAAFIIDKYSHEDFKREFPKATVKSFSTEQLLQLPQFLDDKSVTVCEFLKVEVDTKRRKLRLKDKTEIYEDEIPEDLDITDDMIEMEREVTKYKVMKYLTNGVEILERNELVFSTIPIVTVVGREKWEDGKRVLESKTRKQRAPQMAYDFADSAQIETLGHTPKPKWVMADGQVEGFEDEWAQAHRSRAAYLRYKPITDATGQTLLPPPQRTDMEPPIQAFELAKDSYLRAAQNASGMVSAERKDRVSKSGIAQQQMDQAADIASHHFTDNMEVAICYEGRLVNEALDKVEDTTQSIGLRNPDDTFETAQLQVMQGADGEIQHPYGIGDAHSVHVSAGPNFESQREESRALAEVLIDKAPALIPMAIKLADVGPLTDKMYDVAVASLPPAIQAAYKDEKDQPQIPPEVQQQMQHAQQVIDLLTEQVNQAKQELATRSQEKQMELESKERIEAEKKDLQIKIKDMDAKIQKRHDEVAILIAQMNNATKAAVTHEQLSSKEDTVAFQAGHEGQEAEADRQHTSREAAQDRQHASDESAQDREHASTEGERDREIAVQTAKEKSREEKGKD